MPLETLASDARARLGPPPQPATRPLVSVIVVNRDGVEHLRRLLQGLRDHTDYPRLELIVVDNGSTDESLDFIRSVRAPFPISIVANQHNASFSDANNQGRERARGDLLLFLNNDVEPFERGWLRELVTCLQAGKPRAVGATLLYPHDDRARFRHGFAVQHRGLRFREEEGEIAPALHGWECDPLDPRLGEDIESAAVVAACLLVDPAAFDRVGGFTHGYLYGAEDIDLCLKLRGTGVRVLCSGRALLAHRPGSTRLRIASESERERKCRNRRLLMEGWGALLRRRHDLDALAGGGPWIQSGREQGARAASREEAEAASLCVRMSGPAVPDAGGDPAEELRARAVGAGHPCLVLRGENVDDPHGLEYDIAVHIAAGSRYLPARGQLNVLWAPPGATVPGERERGSYDLVQTGPAKDVLDAVLDAVPRPHSACAS